MDQKAGAQISKKASIQPIVIIVVLFFAGGAFAVLDRTGTMRAFIGNIVSRSRDRKYAQFLFLRRHKSPRRHARRHGT